MASKKLSSFLSRVLWSWSGLMRQPVDNVCNYPDNVHARRLSSSWQKQSVCKLGCKDFNWDAKGRGQLASKQHLYPWLGCEWIGVGWKGGKWNIVNEQVVRPLSACCLPQGSWYVWPAKTTMQARTMTNGDDKGKDKDKYKHKHKDNDIGAPHCGERGINSSFITCYHFFDLKWTLNANS